MKYMKQIGGLFLIMAISCVVISEAYGQNYRTGVGGRIGSPFGFTVKHFISNNSAFEGIVGTRGPGAEVVGLYEFHVYPAQRKEFALYFGGGAHVGAYDHHHDFYWHSHRHVNNDEVIAHSHQALQGGLDGIIGVSWTFTNAPVDIGFDYKPAVQLTHHGDFLYGDAAISVRYVFR